MTVVGTMVGQMVTHYKIPRFKVDYENAVVDGILNEETASER